MTAVTPEREPSDHAVNLLWRRYAADGDRAARDGLILQYASLVKFVAGRLGTRLPSNIESQDLVSYGTIGLIDAIDKFDLDRGLRFETYAVQRIRGAMLDELRRLDWVPRSVRSRATEIQTALADLEHRLGRSATEEELAAHMEVEVTFIRSALSDVAAGGILAFDELAGGDRTLSEILADPMADDPDAAVEAAEIRRILVAAVRGLGERERTIVVLYYFESMTLAQIGDVLDLTESRISQLHTKAVLSLRNRMTLATREA